MVRQCGKRFAAKYEEVCTMDPGHEPPCGHFPVGANLPDCRRMLRLAVKVMQHGTDNQLIDAANFIAARMGGSERDPSVLIQSLWEVSK